MTESYFWQQLHGAPAFSDVDLHRLENSIGSGHPDIEGCHNGKQVWIELKIFKGNRLYFKFSQRVWIRRRCRAGGRVYVLARKDDEVRLYEALDAINNPVAETLAERWFSVEPGEPLWRSGKPFDWESLRVTLFGT